MCGVWQRVTFFEFGMLLGLTEDESNNKRRYRRHLDLASFEAPDTYDRAELWDIIAMEELDPKNYRESNLRTPFLRVLHRYLSWTIIYIHTSNKLNDEQLRGFYFLLNREYRWHLPYVVAHMFSEASGNDRLTHLPGGQFVTEIAMSLGLLDDEVRRDSGPPINFELKGYAFMVHAMVFKKMADDSYVLYRENEKKEEDGSGPSNVRAREKRPRTGQSSQPSYPVNMDHLCRQMDNMGYYMDDQQRMIWKADERAHDRYMTPFGQDLPPTYNQGWNMYPMWQERMGYPAQIPQGGDNDDEEEEGDGNN